ncbi:wd-40 repeat protein [Stylonychia lemnae]|uniref:Wd-40 repeat protein n=1 Tax=Stylonychia lemnae TaxID=5949 RepID=A0A077ZRK8_STYLE|nr:wd-40 repeat protein [Stylonychia lemnae]|eukprot:CDW72553.1 wd-40 repeat protein [Stylonychia lemnae]
MFNTDISNLYIQETSFTYFHWSLIYQLKHDQLKLDDLEPSLVHTLIYNILPGGETIFHALCGKKEQMQKLMEICHTSTDIIFHLPLIPDFKGKTPIHKLIEQNDFRSINMVLRYLAFYEMDHHSRFFLKDVYFKFLEKELPNFLTYLNSVLKRTPTLAKIERGLLKHNYPQVFPSKIWYRDQEINQVLFHQNLLKVRTHVRLDFIDLPGIYHYQDPNFEKFIHQLAETKNFEYFTIPSIQSLIEFNYKTVQRYIIYVIIIPHFIFHFIFVCYMNLVYEYRKDNESYIAANIVLCIIMAVFASYFLYGELRQQLSQGVHYLQNVWNYIDLLTPISVITFLILQFLDEMNIDINQDFMRSIMALATFFMWLKIFYALRIFRNTGYMIRSIVEVIQDMGIFLLILFLTIIAFGDSFLRLSSGNEEGFIDNFFMSIVFTYRMILGDFETDNFGNVALPLAIIFWFMCTILDMIVMLNLLIAIISATYERVASNSEKAAYQEMAKLIYENQYLIPQFVKESYAPKNQYLIHVTNQQKVVGQNDHHIAHQIDRNSYQNYGSILNEKEGNKQTEILIKMTVGQYMLSMNQKGNGVFCDGNKLQKCQSGMIPLQSELRNEESDVIYHCYKCQFDYCDTCYNHYGPNSHQHQLVRTTYREIKKQTSYHNGWLCDARFFTPCENKEKFLTDEKEIIYHDEYCDFNLCSSCAINYYA